MGSISFLLDSTAFVLSPSLQPSFANHLYRTEFYRIALLSLFSPFFTPAVPSFPLILSWRVQAGASGPTYSAEDPFTATTLSHPSARLCTTVQSMNATMPSGSLTIRFSPRVAHVLLSPCAILLQRNGFHPLTYGPL